MISIMIAFTIKAAALFYTLFEIPQPELRLTASVLFAIAASLTMLAASVNSKLFIDTEGNHKFSFPEAFGICSLVLMLIVFKVFEPEVHHWTWYFKRIFLAFFLALLEYVFSKMFVKKYEEHNKTVNRTIELDKVQKELNKVRKELLGTQKELQKVQTEFPCKHCGTILKSTSSKKKHEASCKENPRNQKEN